MQPGENTGPNEGDPNRFSMNDEEWPTLGTSLSQNKQKANNEPRISRRSSSPPFPSTQSSRNKKSKKGWRRMENPFSIVPSKTVLIKTYFDKNECSDDHAPKQILDQPIVFGVETKSDTEQIEKPPKSPEFLVLHIPSRRKEDPAYTVPPDPVVAFADIKDLDFSDEQNNVQSETSSTISVEENSDASVSPSLMQAVNAIVGEVDTAESANRSRQSSNCSMEQTNSQLVTNDDDLAVPPEQHPPYQMITPVNPLLNIPFEWKKVMIHQNSYNLEAQHSEGDNNSISINEASDKSSVIIGLAHLVATSSHNSKDSFTPLLTPILAIPQYESACNPLVKKPRWTPVTPGKLLLRSYPLKTSLAADYYCE